MVRVVHFQEGHKDMKNLLGGKGANLAEMTRSGLPVPPGFTVTTEACRQYFQDHRLPDGLMDEIIEAMQVLEHSKSQKFGNSDNPLLVSVRSGSVTSMPGMMDTILNLGLNNETVEGLAKITNNQRFAYDCYRRLIQMFGNVVFGVESFHFEKILQELKTVRRVQQDQHLTAEDLKQLIAMYQAKFEQLTGDVFPQDVREQLRLAVEAVFRSWNNHRAIVYRKINQIPDEQGTAVNIQSMVFGNLGADSGTGVMFTRNPSTGENQLFGEYLTNAQGEDVVAGIRTPNKISELAGDMPAIYEQLKNVSHQLERHYRDVQDIEFTIERGKLYLLQTRSAKRTAQAAVKIAVDMVKEGILSKQEALLRLDVAHLNQLMHSTIDEGTQNHQSLAAGLPASPGAVYGQIVFDADTAEVWSRQNRKVILVRAETTPEDIHGVLVAEGILTSRGGMTSHAAVVARGMGKACVCGCEALQIDAVHRIMTVGPNVFSEGDWISIDGSTGIVYEGKVAVKEAVLSSELIELISWADEIRHLKVLANADHPEDAAKARELGAEGIGLCRTEHTFFGTDRLPVVRAMILADDASARQEALQQLLPMQQSDFEGIFEAMNGLPVTVRLLDPPLHEFLPKMEELNEQYKELQAQGEEHSEKADELRLLIKKVRSLHETNPMLGWRGCRLGILYPEIYDMQVEAIFRAVKRSIERHIEVKPLIMIPLIGHVNELKFFRERIDQMANEWLGEDIERCPYEVGTMIEVPRAALTADQIVTYADFFSYGTNDLTQLTYGYSRDDAEGKFLTYYVEHKMLPNNPFQVLDREGVGQLIEISVAKGRRIKRELKAGVCGEHGGDKDSIFYCHEIGLDYVSCSPFRVPFARIAAAQAKIVCG